MLVYLSGGNIRFESETPPQKGVSYPNSVVTMLYDEAAGTIHFRNANTQGALQDADGHAIVLLYTNIKDENGAPYGASLEDVVNALSTVVNSETGGGVGTVAWGGITGVLTAQEDLNAALSGKAPTSHTHTVAQISDFATALANYVTNSSLATTLLNYVTNGALTATLANYITSTALATALGGYATTGALTTGLAGKANTSHIHAIADVTGLSVALTTAENNAKAYADALVVGLLDYRGNFDASVNAYPTANGSGAGGAILKGDVFLVTVGGTIAGASVVAGSLLVAGVDNPAQNAANWGEIQNNLGYTPENIGNKNAPNGYAGLSAGGKLLATLLPEATLATVQNPLTTETGTTVNPYLLWQAIATLKGQANTWTNGVQTFSGGASLGNTFANKAITTDASGNLVGTNIGRVQVVMSGNATVTNVLTAGAYVKVAGTTTASNLAGTTAPVSNRITFDAAGTYVLSASGTFTGTNNTDYTFSFALNGVAVGAISKRRPSASGQPDTFAIAPQYITVGAGGFVEMFVTSTNANNDPTVTDMIITSQTAI